MRHQKMKDQVKDEERALSAKWSKTKEEDEVIASLQCLHLLFSSHEMLQLLKETQATLIKTLKNPSLYATKIKGAKKT